MLGGFLITLREGLEAFLVVGILLSYLSKANLTRYHIWIYVGVVLGLISAFIMALFFQIIYSGFESAMAELYVKIFIMGFAVLVLTYMTLWMQQNSRQMKGSVEKKLQQAIGKGSVFALVFMAYLAILREGFETALFLGALYGDEMGMDVLYGGVAGLVIAFIMSYALFKGMKQIPIKSFFKITSLLVLIISAGLLINMVGVMQDIELLPTFYAGVFDLNWLLNDSSDVGIFFKAMLGYTSAPSLIQITSYLGYLFFAYVAMSYFNGSLILKRSRESS